VQWGDRLPWLAEQKADAPRPKPATPEAPPSGESLLANLDSKLARLHEQLAATGRDEREAEVACKLLARQGVRPEHPAFREQAEARARASARREELLAGEAEHLRLRSELLSAMATAPPRPAPPESDLPTQVRTFVIRQQLLREP
jgi:hypothetical protein